jgi:hypothetical protein
MLKQSLIIYDGFVCFASVASVIGNYAVQSFWKNTSCGDMLTFFTLQFCP